MTTTAIGASRVASERRSGSEFVQSDECERSGGPAFIPPRRGRVEMLRAPFPWFGGKSRASSLIWSRLGDVTNYVEPFAGSLAVLLARPHAPRIETVNDLDCHVANFWRAVSASPDEVVRFCDWPVNEADLHARHLWLMQSLPAHRERMMIDPDYFDAKIAGWWVWGLCQWIGSGWCAERKPPKQLPSVGDAGRGGLFDGLTERLRRVRVCCGDWSRVLGDSVTWRHGITGVLLDPPYDDGADVYSEGARISCDVRAWAVENGDNPLLRIALCGYEGEHDMPSTWECVPWKAQGGYGSQRADGTNENAKRERIWFSPHCLSVTQRSLFDGA